MTDQTLTFGTTVKLGRIARKLSQRDFAAQAGVSLRWLTKAEKDAPNIRVRPTQVRLVAAALERDPDELLSLLGGTEFPKPNSLSDVTEIPQEADLIKDLIFRMKWPTASKEKLVAIVSMFVDLREWRDDLLSLCSELLAIEKAYDRAERHEPEINSRFRRWAADVAVRKTIERLKNLAGKEISFDDAMSLEELWSGIFLRVTKKVWTTNIGRLGTVGGRSEKDWVIEIQRKACEDATIEEEFLTRLFVLHREECDESKELNKFVSLLDAQWNAGITIGLIGPNEFKAVVDEYVHVIPSVDYMLLDDRVVYFTTVESRGTRIVKGMFSTEDRHLQTVLEITAKLKSDGNVRWFNTKVTDEDKKPDFRSAIVELAKRSFQSTA